jgi:hypothetical protein
MIKVPAYAGRWRIVETDVVEMADKATGDRDLTIHQGYSASVCERD